MSNDVGSGYVPRFIAILIIITAAGKLVLTLLDKNPNSTKKKPPTPTRLAALAP